MVLRIGRTCSGALLFGLAMTAPQGPALALDVEVHPTGSRLLAAGRIEPAAMGPLMMFPMGHMMMGHDGMMDSGMGGGWSSGLEVRYLPGLPIVTPAAAITPAQGAPAIVGGLDVRTDMGMMGLGAQANVSAQIGSSTGAGNWVTPHIGLLPRLGLGLGPIRVEGGALAGLGVMLRQVATSTGTNALEALPAWLLEPRVEIGLRGDGLEVALIGTYLITPVPGDLGGLTGGMRLSFGGGRSGAGHSPPDAKQQGGHDH